MNGELAPKLRIAMVWSQTLLSEQLLDDPRPVVLGYGPDALFPLPEAHAAQGDLTLLSPLADGTYALTLPPSARGAVWLGGERRDVRELLAHGAVHPLAELDYGVVSFGAASFFFQYVQGPPAAKRALGSLDADALLSFGLSLFVHACALVLLLLLQRELYEPSTLAVRPELVTRLMAVTPPEVIPTPPKEKGEEPAPGPRKREDGGKKRAPREEGKLGRRDATKPDHQLEGPSREATADKVRGMGLLGALSGGDSLKSALEGSSQVGALLSGLDSARTDLGKGAGGRGLRGVGKGGGGDGAGALLGAGALGTGLGTGRGAGGRGGGGAGSGGSGGGRGEAKVQMTPGTPQVNGYLSAEQIDRVVRANQAALRYCYESEVQRQRGLRGKVVLQWRVDRTGAVPTARVASSTLGNANVEGCLLRQVKKWHFPKPDGGEVSVMYPFLFGVGG